MKSKQLRRLISFAIISSTIIGLGISPTSIKNKNLYEIANATSFDFIYNDAYNAIKRLQILEKEYFLTPRTADNNTEMKDNNIDYLVASVNQIQPIINELRNLLSKFPSEYWQAKNTFSAIGDGFQQPIYEWIVHIAVTLNNKLNPSFINNIPKDKVTDIVMSCQKSITAANTLNEGVDPAYKGAYQVALNEAQGKLDNLINHFKEVPEIDFAKRFGKEMGQSTQNQIKDCKKLMYDFNSENILDFDLKMNSLNIIGDEQGFIKYLESTVLYPVKINEKNKVFFTDFVTVRAFKYLPERESLKEASKLYGFLLSFLDHKNILLDGVNNDVFKSFINFRLNQLKELSNSIEKKYGKQNLMSLSQYNDFIVQDEIWFNLQYAYGRSVKIRNIKTVEDLPKEYKDIPGTEKYYKKFMTINNPNFHNGKKYTGELGKTNHNSDVFIFTSKFYCNLQSNICYLVSTDNILTITKFSTGEVLMEYDLNNNKVLTQN